MKEKIDKIKCFIKATLNKKNAQTALELGIFGSILLVMIGAIIRQTMSAGNTQNQQMKAMRWAMTMSQMHAENVGSYDNVAAQHQRTLYPWGFGRASRSNATVLVVEDRLSSSSAKFGALDRVPFMTASGASHTNQLYYPIDDYPLPTETDPIKKIGDTNQVSVIDYFINGKHFMFTTAAFKVVCLTRDKDDCNKFDLAGDPDEDYPYYDEWVGEWTDFDGNVHTRDIDQWWDPYCSTFDVDDQFACDPTFECVPLCPNYTAGACAAWDPWLYDADDRPYKYPKRVPCPYFRRRVYNNLTSEWCVQLPTEPTDTCAEGGNFSEDERFDIDISGLPNTDPDPMDSDTRQHFSYQWYRVQAYDEQKITKKHKNDKKEITSINRGKIYRYPDPAPDLTLAGTVPFPYGPYEDVEGINTDPEASRNMLLDVDYDLKEEGVIKILRESAYHIIEKLLVMDYQDGDIDGTVNSKELRDNPELRTGLDREATIWTTVSDGTTLLIEEGKLYQMTGGGDKQFIRTANMRDQIDIIERTIKLSNDTGRFCEDGAPVNGTVPGNAGFWDVDNPNPVEVCCGDSDPSTPPPPSTDPSCCYEAGNATQTCMDLNELRIYVRSRIKEGRGRKWITESKITP